MLTWEEALATVLNHAEPVEPIEVSLTEAVGLVLAEPAIGDVDLPPFDRAAVSGYAVRAAETSAGTLLHVTEPWVEGDPHDHEIDSGETARVELGDPLPLGADAVIPLNDVRDQTGDGLPTRVVEICLQTDAGQGVKRRSDTLRAGAEIAAAGQRITHAMVPLLATQGVVRPMCHRRVRVSIVAVGDHLINPCDVPVLHHERNATNLSLSSLILSRGAMVHDLGAVAREAFPQTLHRALNAPVVIILGRLDAATARALAHEGVEPLVSGVLIEPGGGSDVGHGVARDDNGRVSAHVFHLPIDPQGALAALSLLVLPLIARLQGETEPQPETIPVVWDSALPGTADRVRLVPAKLTRGGDARVRARAIIAPGDCELPDLALASGLAIFPANQGPWRGGEVVQFLPFHTTSS